MYIEILDRYPKDRDLLKGEASKVKKSDGSYTLLMPCPKCGTEMLLSDHKIIWHNDKLVTVEPSLVCDYSKASSAQILHEADNCNGHFFLKKNIIVDLG